VRERDVSREDGAGFAWLLTPHPGRVRALPLLSGGILGKDEESPLRLDAPGVAAQHASVELLPKAPGVPPEIVITDLGTTTGTYVSGMRAQRTVLADGDLLRVGNAIGLVVEKEIGSYDGAVIEEGGIVRGPRSKRGWFAALERAIAEHRERRALIVAGPVGSGRSLAARRIADAWGIPVAEGKSALAEVDASTIASDDELEAAVARARAGVLLRGLGALEPQRRAHLLRALDRRPRGTPTIVVIEADGQGARADDLLPEIAASLAAGKVVIPSIESRREEIPSLVRALFERKGVHGARLSIELYESLTRAAWPGELAEIAECVARIAEAHPEEPRLGPEHLVRPLSRRGGRIQLRSEASEPASDADRIRQALATHNGSVAGAARALHLSRQALYREAARLGIDIRKTREGEG
jgi:hypothetical protein